MSRTLTDFSQLSKGMFRRVLMRTVGRCARLDARSGEMV